MNAPTRLAVFAIGLLVLFGASFAVAGAVVPDRVVQDWQRTTDPVESDHDGH